MTRNLPKVFITFDVEDFINDRSLCSLKLTLIMLKILDIRAIFFITGHMIEKIANYPTIVEMLKEHEIGYHSSGHSVRPTIFEYTDISDFHKAYNISLLRETSHINPLTGEIEGEGGLSLLRKVFPNKEIKSFRAPGLCWSPPNLMALSDLKIKFDFSTAISFDICAFKGITFFPAPMQVNLFNVRNTPRILKIILERSTTVFLIHPDSIVNARLWDSIYFDENPRNLSLVAQRSLRNSMGMFANLELFYLSLKTLHQAKLLKITSDLNEQPKEIKDIKNELDPAKIYEIAAYWLKFFHYRPKHLFDHFLEFLK